MTRSTLHLIATILLAFSGCAAPPLAVAQEADASAPLAPEAAAPEAAAPEAWFNLAHLDFLGEDVVVDGDSMRFIHIYAEAPDWRFVGDDDEGLACVDDAARAAVVYLRHFETTGDAASRRKAVRLLRFIRHQQAASGLFYNFVWDRALRPNVEHANSRADAVSWWTSRAVWALGVGAELLADAEPEEAALDLAAVRRVEPHLDSLLARYGEMAVSPESGPAGRPLSVPYPQWFVNGIGGDATSELLLGLVAVRARRADGLWRGARPPVRGGSRAHAPGRPRHVPLRRARLVAGLVARLGQQPDAGAGGGRLGRPRLASAAEASAVAEARTLFAHLLVEGWQHEMLFPTHSAREFEQIAYSVRTVAVGLVRLHEATGDPDYLTMAGLAASWLTGNNAAGAVMADPATGRGYDGILSPTVTNGNAGAESTIEAQFTLLEVERDPRSARWLGARGDAPRTVVLDGRTLRLRAFHAPDGVTRRRRARPRRQHVVHSRRP